MRCAPMPTDRTSDREQELKLAVPEGAAGMLLDHPVLGLSGPDARRKHQVSTYYDTVGETLARNGVALRVRRNDGTHVQTVKAAGRAGIAADRGEWEWPVDDDLPDASLLARTPIADRLPAGLDLRPVVTTEIDRTSRMLRLDDGTEIEAAFDAGWIIAGNAREPVRELELELRRGNAGALYRLALQLHASMPLTIETAAKSERGFRLRRGAQAGPSKAAHVALASGTPGAGAFREIMAVGLHHLLVNRPAALAGNAEGLHQMRVAVRRLRAGLALFQPHLERHALARFQAELRRIGRVFGEARGWDVFCRQILPDMTARDTAGWGSLLRQPAEACREAAYRAVTQAIGAPDFTALVLGLAAWAEQGCTAANLLGDHALHRPISRLCPDLLDRLADKVEHRGRHIDDGSDADRHALRKSLKKLRYASDYVAGAYPRKAVESYLHRCKKLQQTLGDISDTVAATGLAERLAERHTDLAPALSALACLLTARRQDALHDLPRRWRKFQHEQRFWS